MSISIVANLGIRADHHNLANHFATDQNYYLPIEGRVGSERLPSFQQVDGQLNYLMPFGLEHQVVFYLAVNNLLNRANVLGYDYTIDYTRRQPRTTTFRRSIYFGAIVTLNH